MRMIAMPRAKDMDEYAKNMQTIANTLDPDVLKSIAEMCLKSGSEFNSKFKKLANNPFVKGLL